MPFSTRIYQSWRKIQREKYTQLWPRVSEHFRESFSVLDFGIGKAWFYEFLDEQGFGFARVVGVDNDQKMVEPRRDGVSYIITGDFHTPERFDSIIAFDSLHLARQPAGLEEMLKPGGTILATEPSRFRDSLSLLRQHPFTILDEGEIGETEEDFYTLSRKEQA
ncbi:methyltransferase domain-containing protein [Candidatus Micrarchaeota archaeon]|nr:methyltransferase domain-containing protein [Candidatus Micrarchaeota archaeon]